MRLTCDGQYDVDDDDGGDEDDRLVLFYGVADADAVPA
jgi:hypothetical protein